ncbi:hypothetical protein BH09PSE5_BH09PSE5_40390 [soil metagenome]
MRRPFPALVSTFGTTLCVAGVLALSVSFSAVAATDAASTGAVAATSTARVIVKFKAGSKLLSPQSAPLVQATDRAHALGKRMGMNLQAGLAIGERAQVVTASGLDSAQLAQRLSKEADVEFAVEDKRRFRMAIPDDSLYGSNLPAPFLTAGQWYLHPPSSDIPAAINAENAWDITTGLPNVVVAVLDSGVRYDHADLSQNMLPGYDMISREATANDGDLRDADASDPGDWVTREEAFTPGGPFAGCAVENSSWHGTQIAGLIAANSNNGTGMASVGRNVKVLPVRVLGKCGGYDSDIVAGMRWAVGLQVGNLPINRNPAKILNLSLGSGGTCSQVYTSAIADVKAAGALVVASAGNSAGHSVSTPANCPGVLAVGGLRHVGTKVGYSDVGPEITISAPAGNCVTSSGTCQYPILTTTNASATAATPNSSIYTDGGDDASLGTSFSAPLVAGTAALVWSARPGLTSDEVTQLLVASARPFPTTGAGTTDNNTPVPACHASNGVDQLECYCTTSTCGAGMLDAAGATSLATAGLYGRITSDPTPAAPTQPLQLSAATSLVATSRAITSYTWAITDGGGIVTGFTGRSDGPTASVTPTGNGRFTVALSIVDNTNVASTVSRTIVVGDPSLAQPAAQVETSGGGGGAIDATWLALLGLAVCLVAFSQKRGNVASRG